MQHHPVDLFFREVQVIFPEFSTFDITVLCDLQKVGNVGEHSVESPDHPENSIGQDVTGGRVSRIVDAVVEQSFAF